MTIRRVTTTARRSTLITALASMLVLGGAGFAEAVTPAISTPPSSPPPTIDTPAPERYIVVYNDSLNAPAEVTAQLADRLTLDPQQRYASALKGFSAALTDSQARALRAQPSVAFVQADQEVQAAGTQPLAAGETASAGIRRVRAVNGTVAHEPAVGPIAVVDSGIDLSNADLDARTGINCIKPGTAAQDDNGHGTNVAGIIAARNNGAGHVGVAPGTTLYAVKALGRTGTGTLSQILCGIDWVTSNAARLGIHVANMSITASGADDGNCGKTNNDAWHRAICNSVAAGVAWVVAAGNNGGDFARSIPAAYPEVLTATAMTDTDGVPGATGPAPTCQKGAVDDRYASFSNYAVRTSDVAHTIAGPGTCVTSTKNGGGSSTYSGTSQAAPHVAGAVALCLGTTSGPGPCTGLAPVAITQRVISDASAHDTLATGFTGDPLRPLNGRYYGPLVNADGY